MCGIYGRAGPRLSEEAERRALATMAHRGPDNTGLWRCRDHEVCLGHRRLAIVDLSDAGSQPMHNEDGTVHLVCNGEIYNYPSLRSRLEGLGHHFSSNSDSEGILHAYEVWGDRCVDHLEGMYAFAIFDEKANRLFAARDGIGIKPLYYTESSDGLLLASEARALLRCLSTIPDLDPLGLAYAISLGYVPSPWSIWKGIKKLEPGHTLIWSPSAGSRVQPFWEPPRHSADSSGGTEKPWRELFHEVLQQHLLSDVPVALFLSSGLDSTSVAVGLSEIGRSVEALTVGYPQSPDDEAPLAETICRHLRLPHRRIPLKPQNFDSLLDQVSQCYDEPQAYTALLSMHLISEVAAKRYKVALAGDGGDEVFGGYSWYAGLNTPVLFHGPLMRRASRAVLRCTSPPFFRRKAYQFFSQSSLLHRHLCRVFLWFLPEEVEALLAPLGPQFGDTELLAPLEKHFVPDMPTKRALQRVDLMTFCTDSILAKVDRASMGHSLEVRVPFLDRRIIEWGLTRPVQPEEERSSKAVLRDYLGGKVPSAVLAKPKQGFSVRGMEHYDWDKSIQQIRRGVLATQGYWSQDWERLLVPGVPHRVMRIQTLLMITRWADHWLRTDWSSPIEDRENAAPAVAEQDS